MIAVPPTDPADHAIAAMRERVAGSSIDRATFLSADYFNLFNEVIMVLSIVPDLVEDLEAWQFRTYEEHFEASGLPIAELAIEAYALTPSAVREEFQMMVGLMRDLVGDARGVIANDLATGDIDAATIHAQHYAEELQGLVGLGGLIVCGRQGSMNQDAIDGMFGGLVGAL